MRNKVYDFQAFTSLTINLSITNKNKTNKIRILQIFIKWHNIYQKFFE